MILFLDVKDTNLTVTDDPMEQPKMRLDEVGLYNKIRLKTLMLLIN